LLVFKPILNWK